MNNVAKSKKITRIVFNAFAVMVMFVILFPVLWLLRNSIIESVHVYDRPPALFFTPTPSAYVRAFYFQHLFGRMINSIIISIFATSLAVLLGSMAAYGVTRFHSPLNNYLPFGFLFLRMLPSICVLLPVFLMFTKMRMVDTYRGLVFIYAAGSVPTVIWMMWGFFKDLPREIEESAYIDGVGYFGTFIKIIIPITTPAFASVGILAFTGSWNDYIMATVLTRFRTMTLPPAVVALINNTELAWDQISAGGVVLTIPVAGLCIFAQKYFVQGLTAGAVKG
ncbi:MAG: carbohydrate ABC transporter permease [Treponema sp.]|jgi:multiple sugar transport system permease protein|nr:carbohydrate ABC transporter permease [Treponema sp.]